MPAQINDNSVGSPRELGHQDFEFIVRRMATDIAMGSDPSPFVGSGLEYSSSRPYLPGDSVRTMNWRLTARHSRPFVKQYEVLKRVPMFVVLDTSRSMTVSSIRLSKRDAGVWIAAALALVGLRRLSPVAIASHGRNVPRPSLKRSDLWLALEPLRTGHAPVESSLAESLAHVEANARATSVVVVISDFHEPNALASVRNCAGKHDTIAVRLTDPAEGGRLRAGFLRGAEAETNTPLFAHGRTAWETDERVADTLLRAGVDVLSLSTADRLTAALRRFLESRGGLQRSSR